jgi:hypothetical protein
MQSERRSLIGRAVITVVGTLLVAVGLVGLFLPILPGIVLIASGLALLGKQYHWARTALDRVTPARLKRPTDETREAEAA